MGKLPDEFDGDRTKADDFIAEVQQYLRLNQDVAGYNSPIKKVAFTLTCMKGPIVAAWIRDVGNMLDQLDPTVDNIPAVWDQFLEQFEEQYQDSQKQDRARQELQKCKMTYPYLDQYVSKFEELARLSGFTLGNPEVTDMFQRGLPYIILKATNHAPYPETYEEHKQRAKEATRAEQKMKRLLSGDATPRAPPPQNPNPRRNFFGQANQNWRQSTPSQFNSSNAPRWMNNQSVPMDIGRTRPQRGRGGWSRGDGRGNRGFQRGGWQPRPFAQGNLAGAEDVLRKYNAGNNNECFNCGRPGHYARNCPRKRAATASLIDFDEGFSHCLIRSALIRRNLDEDVYISARKSMTIRFFIHSITKRAESVALLDSGATENFMNLSYAKWLRLPIKQLERTRKLFNADGTENKSGELKYFTDLNVRTGIKPHP
jgi:hypothetical protein